MNKRKYSHESQPRPTRSGSFFARFSITARIGLLTGITLLSIIVMGGGFAWNYTRLTAAYQESQDIQEQSKRGADLFARSLQLRQAEKDYLLHKETGNLNSHKALSHALNNNITAYIDHIDNPELLDRLMALQRLFAAYQTNFTQVVNAITRLGITDDTGLNGRLKHTATKAEEALDETNLPGVQVNLLKMRKFEKNYILNKNKTSQVRKDSTVYFKIHLRNVKRGFRGTNISDERKEKLLKLIGEYEQSFNQYTQLDDKIKQTIQSLDQRYTEMIPHFKAIADHAAIKTREADQRYETATRRFILITMIQGGAIFLLSILISIPLSRSLTTPIRLITDSMKALADNKTPPTQEIVLNLPPQNNEIGAMVRAIETFHHNRVMMAALQKEQTAEREKQLAKEKKLADKEYAQAAQKIAERKEDQQKDQQKRQAIEALCLNFEKIVAEVLQNFHEAARNMNSSAETMFSLADGTNEKTTALAATSEQSAHNVTVVSQAITNLLETVQDINVRMDESSLKTRGAVVEIEKAGKQIVQLEKASEKIGNVIRLIQDIANQTNLLALNATIESARAGEAGKGFAVVAAEVKNLARQTAEATDEIATQVHAMCHATEDTISFMHQIKTSISDISATSQDITQSATTQHQATIAISDNVNEITQGIGLMVNHIDSVARDADETTMVANIVLDNTAKLNQQSCLLHENFERFLHHLKTV